MHIRLETPKDYYCFKILDETVSPYFLMPNGLITHNCRLKNKIQTENIPIILYKPVPSPIDKIKNKFRWRIIIKCRFGEDIIGTINECIEQVFNGKNRNVSMIVDVNPNNML